MFSESSSRRCVLLILLTFTLAACASVKSPPHAAPVDAEDASSADGGAEHRFRQAVRAAQPRGGNLSRARSLLESLLASNDDDARALHPYAKAMLDQLIERQRLDAANRKLAQQLERTGVQLKYSQARADELQGKLDALADIERSLPALRGQSR